MKTAELKQIAWQRATKEIILSYSKRSDPKKSVESTQYK